MKVRFGSNSRRLHRSGTFVSDIARRCTSLLVSIAFLLAPVLPAAFPSIAQAHPALTPPAAPAGTAGCSLQSANGQIQHISTVNGPGFLGWEPPPVPVSAPEPDRTNPPAPTRPANAQRTETA